METSNGPQVLIPLRGSEQQVLLNVENLPAEVYDVIELLRSEAVPRQVWMQVARLYSSTAQHLDCIRILEDTLRPEAERILSSMDSDHTSKGELLISLGGAYVFQAQAHGIDEQARRKYMDKASEALNEAEKISVNSCILWEAKAWKEVFENNLERARSFFETAASIGQTTATGRLGMAALLLNFQDVAGAGKYFRTTIRNFRCPKSAWLGLAHSFYKNGRMKQAKESFERVLNSEKSDESFVPEVVEALICLASLEYNSDAEGSAKQALFLLKKACENQLSAKMIPDSRILSHASEIFFYGGNVGKAENLAFRAAKSTNYGTPPLFAADVMFQLARIAHYNGRYEEALEQYQQSLVLEKQAAKDANSVPQLHLGIGLLGLAIGQNVQVREVVEHLQSVLKTSDRCFIARRAMGVAIARSALRQQEPIPDTATVEQKREQARAILKQGLAEEGGEDDIPGLICYAQLNEQTHPEVAVEFYQKALVSYEKRQDSEPYELLNNLAALQARLMKIGDAKQTLARAIDVVTKREACLDKESLGARYVTLLYNYARLLEMSGDRDEAERSYRSIIKRFPDYSDANIRLGYVLEERGDLVAAEECAKRAMTTSSDSSRSFALSLLSAIYKRKRDFPTLQKFLEMGNEKKYDRYAEIALVSFWNENLHSMEQERRQRMLERIYKGFSNVLRENPSNALAAAGIGCYLAANGHWSDARDVFSTVVAHSYCGSMFKMNLAHVQVEIGKDNTGEVETTSAQLDSSCFQQAAKLYNDVLISMPRGNANLELLMYLARSLFEAGDYTESLKIMQKSLHLSPQFLPLWYNFAVVLQECSLVRMERHNKVVRQIKIGAAELDRAQKLFQRLRTFEPYEGSGPVRMKPLHQTTDAHYRYCRERLNKARVVLVNAEQEEKTSIERMEQQKREIEEHLAKERAAVEEAERRREEEKRELEDRQRALDEKVKQDLLRAEQEQDENEVDDLDNGKEQDVETKEKRKKDRGETEYRSDESSTRKPKRKKLEVDSDSDGNFGEEEVSSTVPMDEDS